MAAGTRWVPRKGQLVSRQQVRKGLAVALGQERSLEVFPETQRAEPSGPRNGWLQVPSPVMLVHKEGKGLY